MNLKKLEDDIDVKLASISAIIELLDSAHKTEVATAPPHNEDVNGRIDKV